jgi:AcrR family transcriptional regulator
MARATRGKGAVRGRGKERPPARPAPAAHAKEPGEARRGELLEAAYALTAEKGLEGLRTRDIAARAGVNISTLHYYFGTKDALLAALLEHVSGKFDSENARRAARARRGAQTLTAHVEAAWLSFQGTPHLSTVLQELVLRAERHPDARAAFRALHDSWNGRVEDILREGIARGELSADLDPRAGARIVTSFIMGAMVQLGVNPKAFDFGPVARELTRWLARTAKK